MEAIVKVITDFIPQMNSAQIGMAGIFSALVAIGLLALLFSKLGK